MKKIIALCVSMLFVISLGIAAFGEELQSNPWEQKAQATAKKGDKAGAKAVKANNKGAEKAKKGNAKKTTLARAEKPGVEKTAQKESGQKKKFLFW